MLFHIHTFLLDRIIAQFKLIYHWNNRMIDKSLSLPMFSNYFRGKESNDHIRMLFKRSFAISFITIASHINLNDLFSRVTITQCFFKRGLALPLPFKLPKIDAAKPKFQLLFSEVDFLKPEYCCWCILLLLPTEIDLTGALVYCWLIEDYLEITGNRFPASYEYDCKYWANTVNIQYI